MRQNRIAELDLARALMMLSVIALHSTSTYIFAESSFCIWGINLAYYINQLVRYCVPGFIMLSGSSLALGGYRGGVRKFYISRVKKVIVPYVIWFALYFAYANLKSTSPDWSIPAFFSGLFTGSSAPHLYFIVVIAQLYLLYPLLRRLMELRSGLTLFICFVTGLSLSAIDWLSRMDIHILPHEDRLYLGCFTWIHYFALGIFMTEDRIKRLCRWAGAHAFLLAALSAIAAVGCVLESRFVSTHDSSIKPHLFIYAPLILSSALGLGCRLKNFRPFVSIVRFLSGISMDVYFCHVLVIQLLKKTPLYRAGTPGMLLFFAAAALVSLLFAAALNAVKRRLRAHGK